MDPFIGASLLGGASSIAQSVIQGGPKRQFKWAKKYADYENQINRQNQQWLLQQNKELEAEQRQYDSPQAAMQRFKDAGLNPNLIYGNGSSVGQAFPINAGQMPGVHLPQVDARIPVPDVAGNFIGAAQGLANLGLTEARTSESAVRTQLTSIQSEIAANNPMLSPDVAQAVSDEMMNTAKLKSAQSWYQKNSWMDYQDSEGRTNTSRVYVAKIHAEVEAMIQKLGLNTSDLAVKNKILESKEFENAVKEINAKWLKDGDITPEHIRQGLMLILQSMMR